MIGTPTTFVTGAGASQPYGLPLGPEVHTEAMALTPNHELYQLLRTLHPESRHVDEFIGDLRNHPATSIDEFLETRQDQRHFMQVGRSVLAGLMGVAISKKPKRPGKGDWLSYLFGRMAEGAPTWNAFVEGNSRVRFVTFNFDSEIEQRLVDDLSRRYRPHFGTVERKETLERIRTIHVHGQLPDWTPTGQLVRGPFNEVDGDWLRWTKEASDAVNVTIDTVDTNTLAESQESLRNAAVVCFLGFSYHPYNLNKLSIPASLKKDSYQTVFGSAFHLSEGERELVRARVRAEMSLGGDLDDCLDVLRLFHVLRD